MINVLIIDDNSYKVGKIKQLINEIPESIKLCDSASDLVTARNYLASTRYDLVLLDLQLPQRFGDDAKADAGIQFLNEITRSVRLIKPIHIIGLTAHENLVTEYFSLFESHSWSLIQFVENDLKWHNQIKNKIDYLLDLKREMLYGSAQSQFDLAIITALSLTELEAVLRLSAKWQAFKVPNDSTEYHKGIFKRGDKRISVVAASAPQMGMTASAVLTTKMIHNFRPLYVAMTGIAAGIFGKGNYGDILIADLAFDSGSGKITTDPNSKLAKFEPDYRMIDINIDIKESLISCVRDRKYLDDIYKSWPAEKPQTILNVQLGPFGSGAGVVENESLINEMRGHTRKLIGVDMESYGVYYAVNNSSKPRPRAVISLKAISDFANPDKDDRFQKYAAYTSANYLYNFALDFFEGSSN